MNIVKEFLRNLGGLILFAFAGITASLAVMYIAAALARAMAFDSAGSFLMFVGLAMVPLAALITYLTHDRKD